MITSLLNAPRSIFLALSLAMCGFLVFAAPALGSAPFTDNFDDYSLGNLTGQDSWTDTPSFQVIDTGCVAGKCVESVSSGYANKLGTALTSGEWYFDFKWTGTITTKIELRAWNYTSGGLAYINIEPDGDVFLNMTAVGNIPVGEWHTIGLTWLGGSIEASIDGGDWSTSESLAGDGSIDMIWQSNANNNAYYLDNFADSYTPPTPPEIPGYDPILTPTTPPRNISTVVNLDDMTMSGLLEIPTANTWIWDHLIVKFYKQNSIIPARAFSFDLGDLVAGQSISYSATTTIPYTVPGNNFYKVQYSLTGHKYAGSIVDNPTIDWPLLSFPQDNTWVSDNAGTPPASQIVLSTLPQQDALEDCGAYSGIDAMFCNLKNFISGAFLPSNDAINQLSSTMNGFKDKFPMNYAAAISDTLGAIGAGVNDAAGFSFSLFGHSGTVDTTIFSQDLGAGVTVGGTIKLILTFLVLVVFLIWGMNYMHRIFR